MPNERFFGSLQHCYPQNNCDERNRRKWDSEQWWIRDDSFIGRQDGSKTAYKTT